MTNIRIMSFPIFIILALTSSCCKSPKSTSNSIEEHITIYQGGREIKTNESGVVRLQKKPFIIRFTNQRYNPDKKQYYSTQIAAFLNHAEQAKITLGTKKEHTTCFRPGTGMAPSESNYYESLIFTTEGHHYIYYQDQKNHRATLVYEENDRLRLEFPVRNFTVNGKTIKIKDADISTFYLSIVNDKNLNNIIEEGELTQLTFILE